LVGEFERSEKEQGVWFPASCRGSCRADAPISGWFTHSLTATHFPNRTGGIDFAYVPRIDNMLSSIACSLLAVAQAPSIRLEMGPIVRLDGAIKMVGSPARAELYVLQANKGARTLLALDSAGKTRTVLKNAGNVGLAGTDRDGNPILESVGKLTAIDDKGAKPPGFPPAGVRTSVRLGVRGVGFSSWTVLTGASYVGKGNPPFDPPEVYSPWEASISMATADWNVTPDLSEVVLIGFPTDEEARFRRPLDEALASIGAPKPPLHVVVVDLAPRASTAIRPPVPICRPDGKPMNGGLLSLAPQDNETALVSYVEPAPENAPGRWQDGGGDFQAKVDIGRLTFRTGTIEKLTTVDVVFAVGNTDQVGLLVLLKGMNTGAIQVSADEVRLFRLART
jgi:hypothetical protein